MKSYAKRILTALLCLTMVVSCIGIGVFAAETEGIRGSFVEFSNNGTTETAKAWLRNPQGNTSPVGAWLVLAAYKDNILVDARINAVELASGNERVLKTEIDNINEAEYKAYIWYKDLCTPVAYVANDKAITGALLSGITIDGTPMEDFSPSTTEYTRAPGADKVVPITKGVTVDNSVYTTTRYIKKDGSYQAVVSAEDAKGNKQRYTITYSMPEEAAHAVASYTTNTSAGEKTISGTKFTDDPGTYQGKVAIDGTSISAIKDGNGALLCSNFHANPDWSDLTKSGSRATSDNEALTGQGHQVLNPYSPNLSAPSELKGLDYFVINNNTVRSGGYANGTTLVTFTLKDAAEVIIASVDNDSFTDFPAMAKNDALKFMGTFKNSYTGYETTDFKTFFENSRGNLNAYEYSYFTRKSFKAGDTVPITITWNGANKRSPFIFVKPVEELGVKGLISDYEQPYAGMNLTQFAAATGKTIKEGYNNKNNFTIRNDEMMTVTLDENGDGVEDDPVAFDNPYYQRKFLSIDKVTGVENGYVIRADREISSGGGQNSWATKVFYGVDDNYPFAEKLEPFVWKSFKVNRDCEVLVFDYGTNNGAPAHATFLDNEDWTSVSYGQNNMPFRYQRNGGEQNSYYYAVWAKEYKAGETVELYNTDCPAVAGQELPYMAMIRFK